MESESESGELSPVVDAGLESDAVFELGPDVEASDVIPSVPAVMLASPPPEQAKSMEAVRAKARRR